MGGSISSLRCIDNDFELVIRVSKALEQKLVDDYGADPEKPLAQRINALEDNVDRSVIQDMHILNQLRNKLVHDPNVNGLRDLGFSREKFLSKFENAMAELNSYHASRNMIRSMEGRDHLVRSAMENTEGSVWAALAIGALAVGAAVAVASSSSSGTGWRCHDCNDRPGEGARRYKCRLCVNFDVCHSCWVSRTPPSCGHRSYQVRSNSIQPWIPVTWQGG